MSLIFKVCAAVCIYFDIRLLAQISLLCNLDDSTWTLWASVPIPLYAQVGYVVLTGVDFDYPSLHLLGTASLGRICVLS